MSAVDELLAYVRRCVDEDERVAREAIAAHDGRASWEIEQPKPEDPTWYTPRLLWLDVTDSTSPETMPPGMAEHIALWDPKRVLAEVEAKRRILDEILQYEAKIDGEWGCLHAAHQIEAGECPGTRPDEITGIRLLAQPYAGREGWQEAWRA